MRHTQWGWQGSNRWFEWYMWKFKDLTWDSWRVSGLTVHTKNDSKHLKINLGRNSYNIKIDRAL